MKQREAPTMRTLQDYIAERTARDPEFRIRWESEQPLREASQAIIGARLSAGLTQAELAAKLGTTQSAIARLESGTGMPRVDTFQKLARVLGVRFEITPEKGLIVHAPKNPQPGKRPARQLRARRPRAPVS